MTCPESVPVLFLAGIGRSGTTLIERTLAETDGVTTLGEVIHLWERGLVLNELCGCGLPFLSCPFWTQVGSEAFGGWDRVDAQRMAWLKHRVDRASRVPSVAAGVPHNLLNEVDEYVDHYERLYRAAYRMVGGVLIDSSKQVSLAWCLQRSRVLNLRVVHCLRDSRGVAYSWAKEVTRPEAVDAEHEMMPRFSATMVSAVWTLHNIEIELLRRRVPLLRLRYEDFIHDPKVSVRAVLDLASVPEPVKQIHGSSVFLGSNHSCAGNPMRFRTGEIELVQDESWRREQPKGQRLIVTSITAPLLSRYGYAL